MNNRIRGDKFRSQIVEGQRVHCTLSGGVGMDGIVYQIDGEQSPKADKVQKVKITILSEK